MVADRLSVAVIQTSLNADAAWQSLAQTGDWRESIRMSSTEERRAKGEIRQFLSSIKNTGKTPDIILLPELAVPLGFERQLVRMAESMESIVIAGLDYQLDGDPAAKRVSNESIVIVPRRLKGRTIASQTATRRVGKTYPAPAEEEKLRRTGVTFSKRPTVWIFESSELGRFGVAVCYDVLDLDRIVLYRSKVQTLFILAYNRDITSFDHVAEAIARMVFCNVVICNCGLFGGSIAISPFKEPFKRTVYRHSGAKLTNAQVVELPLAALVAHQRSHNTSEHFKSRPPGFSGAEVLTVYEEPF